MSSEAIKTGVIVSAEHTAEVLELSKAAAHAPVMRVHGRWMNELAHEVLMARIDALAVEYGLPPPIVVDGEVWHYGMLRTGEFTRLDPPASP